MTVFLNEVGASRIRLDISSKPTLITDSSFREALMAFMIIDQDTSSITIDTSPDIIEAITFLTESFDAANIPYTLSSTLETIAQSKHHERQIIKSITAPECPDQLELPEQIPGLLKGVALLPHQSRGLKKTIFVQNMAEFSVQGAGKTLITLAAFRVWQHQGVIVKMIVIGPTSSRKPWEDEIHRWLNHTEVLRWSGSALHRTRLVSLFGRTEIILCTYETAIRDVEMLSNLLKTYPTLVVLDESHYIKNFDGGARAEMATKLAPLAKRRMILTGTPAPHSLLDLWNQFAFLWPTQVNELLGTRVTFQTRIEQGHDSPGALGRRLQPFFHRTTQAELQLPAPQSHFVKISSEKVPQNQTRILRLLEARLKSEIRKMEEVRSNQELVMRWRKARIIRLLQAASNPGLLTTTLSWLGNDLCDFETGDLSSEIEKFARGELLSGKISWTVEKAKEIIAEGKKVVIWTWWVENLQLLVNLFSGYSPLVVYGDIKPFQEDWDDKEEISREKNISEFLNDPNRMLLLANPAACAESISLHRECHDAIYLDRTYNCGQFLQSMNRIHRVGLPPNAITRYWIPYLDCAIERSVNQRLTKRQETLYQFLNDSTAILGFDEDDQAEIADTNDEIGSAFLSLTTELQNSPPT